MAAPSAAVAPQGGLIGGTTATATSWLVVGPGSPGNPLVAGGTENWIPGTVEHLAEHLVSTGLVTASDVESVLAMTADRSCHYVPSPMVTAWGQRPR